MLLGFTCRHRLAILWLKRRRPREPLVMKRHPGITLIGVLLVLWQAPPVNAVEFDPVLRGSWPGYVRSETTGPITVHDGCAYAVWTKGFFIFDITNPENPTLRGQYKSDEFILDLDSSRLK
ncbi:MAG: hypothetical protein ACR2OZ_05220 [Verrucomicrobiales bacterium]